MQLLVAVLFLVAIGADNSVNECPSEQEVDWEIELLLEHEDCDKFYKCTHGQPVEMLCPEGLYFNIELWQCDWPSNVDCGDRNVPDDEESESEEDICPPPEVPDFEVLDNGCPANSSIHWLLPHENNCNQFYYCVFGKTTLRQCPSSLHFNSRLQVCDWPDNACCARSFNKHVSSRRRMMLQN